MCTAEPPHSGSPSAKAGRKVLPDHVKPKIIDHGNFKGTTC